MFREFRWLGMVSVPEFYLKGRKRILKYTGNTQGMMSLVIKTFDWFIVGPYHNNLVTLYFK